MVQSSALPNFIHGINEAYLDQMYERYLQSADHVPKDWADYFASLGDVTLEELEADQGRQNKHKGQEQSFDDASDPWSGSLRNGSLKTLGAVEEILHTLRQGQFLGEGQETSRRATLDALRAMNLIRSFRILGHFRANLDPLGLQKLPSIAELEPSYFGFREDDWDRPIYTDFAFGMETSTLREILALCKKVYCGQVGFEYMHIANMEERVWIREQIELNWSRFEPSASDRRRAWSTIHRAMAFEDILQRRFTGAKRFGIEGGESLLAMLDEVVLHAASQGVEELVIGMAHRGRLNVLANLMGKPYSSIFAEFQGKLGLPEEYGSGDVKYHLGFSNDLTIGGQKMHFSLTPNPSHLECVNTVVLGKVRAKQDQIRDTERRRVMGLLMHGDAAFIAQGVVAETMLLSQLDGYKTGGTLHIGVNNQIGFTTRPSESRSSPYCSDMAKTIDAPVFHVNGDNPDAVLQVTRLACEYRARYQKDVVLDLWCYRRRGHNEGDEPMFTQPRMYRAIANHKTVGSLYADKLVSDGVMDLEEVEGVRSQISTEMEQSFQDANKVTEHQKDWLSGRWSSIRRVNRWDRAEKCEVALDLLREVGVKITSVPEGLNVDSKIRRQLKKKQQIFTADHDEGLIDWGLAESLGLGTLVIGGNPVRFSGEDTVRGTFSHRHAAWIDQTTEQRYIPLDNLRPDQARFDIFDSPLSEFGLLGFEYGYAMTDPNTLVIWEAQFGDFANGAQVIIDQYIASGEAKWLRMCGLVMLLPHGYEGQGPEHSSARLERYLQSSAGNNWLVANITSPANYFHVLRHQVKRDFRKPLIQMTPKSLLRHPECVSPLSDFGPGSYFHRVLWDSSDARQKTRLIDETLRPDEEITRVIICSGRIYFDLIKARRELERDDIYVLRLEQLYPFPDDALEIELKRFPRARFVWCQEETRNAGALSFVDRRLKAMLSGIGHNQPLTLISRDEASSPATGSLARHKRENDLLLSQALTGDVDVAS